MKNKVHTFDGSSYTITESPAHGLAVKVTEGEHDLELVTRDGTTLVVDAAANAAAMVRAGMDAWTADRIAYVFGLAARRIIAG